MQQQEDGISVVLSPIQLAAILKNGSITEAETLSNRLWGGANIVFGVVELMGAGVLCAAPEPTMLTKVGCVAVGVHGLDTINTGARQVVSGRQEMSSTQHAASETAKIAGAMPQSAQNIALGVDIAVALPFGTVKGASKIASINGGVFKLSAHEARVGSKIGGHAIFDHVGKTLAQMRARLIKERKKVVSSFYNLEVAERAISQTLKQNDVAITQWAKNALLRKDVGVFEWKFSEAVGHAITSETGPLINMSGVRVVLKYEAYNGMPYYILTAYLI